ncbi:MAG: GDP-mannose 4,6-dehydratase [Thermoproteota archaeon]
MKVLVTGGAGFIGSHAAEFFSRKGYEVVVLDNFARSEVFKKDKKTSEYNWNYLKELKNVKLVKGDIRKFEEVKDASKGCSTIVHAAAQVAVTTSLVNPLLDFEINALGTLNVLEAARINDASLIFTSTNKVYGENVNRIQIVERENRYEYSDEKFKEGIPEDFPIDLTGHSPYGCSKLAADVYVQDYAHTYGLGTVVFRQSCIYGERQFGVEDQGWVAWFLIASLLSKTITIYGDGKQVRDVLYIEDLLRAIELALSKISSLKGEVFNIGGGINNAVSLLEVIRYIEEISGKSLNLRFSEWRKSDQKVYISNIRKAKEKLNWEPRISWKEGIRRVYDWILRNKSLFNVY